MSECFSQRIFVSHNGWQVRGKLRLDRDPAVGSELRPGQFETTLHWRPDVERFHIQFGRMRKGVELSNNFVQPVDFLDDNIGEILSKISVIKSFRQKLSEGLNGDQRIANFV